jgi:hypothetical protein
VTLIVGISNSAGNADSATLHVSAVGLQFVSAKVDRGSGCTADGSGASCFLDFFNSGLASSEELTFRVTSLPASASASVTSSPTGTSETGTWSASAPASLTPAATAPLTPPRTPTAAEATSALTSVKTPAAVKLGGKSPTLTVTVVLARKATLKLVLVNTKGRTAASWSRSAKAGEPKLKLVLPKKARKAGRYTLRVTVSGHTTTVPVTLRA